MCKLSCFGTNVTHVTGQNVTGALTAVCWAQSVHPMTNEKHTLGFGCKTLLAPRTALNGMLEPRLPVHSHAQRWLCDKTFFTYFNILSDDFWVITYWLHKENLDKKIKVNFSRISMFLFVTEHEQQNKTTNLVPVFLSKAQDDLSALRCGVGGIKNLTDTQRISDPFFLE